MSSAEVANYIFGGSKHTNNEFVVALIIVTASMTKVIGGATIISDKWLITAARCIPHLEENESFGIYSASGSLDDKKSSKEIHFQKYFIHPKYEPTKSDRLHDIALIHTKESMKEFKGSKSIKLDNFHETEKSWKNMIAMGYGKTSLYSGDMNNQLHYVTLNMAKNDNCFYDEEKMISAGDKNGRGTYKGDSGGPLIFKRNYEDILIGIVSGGPEGGPSCGPTIFTRVSYYQCWILETMSHKVVSYINLQNETMSEMKDHNCTDHLTNDFSYDSSHSEDKSMYSVHLFYISSFLFFIFLFCFIAYIHCICHLFFSLCQKRTWQQVPQNEA